MATAQIESVEFRHIDLSGAVLPRFDFSNLNLSEANLKGANFSGADFSRANLTGTNLAEAKLRQTTFVETNLSNADLRGVDLTGADLRGALLRDADLKLAKFQSADLRGVDLTRAKNVRWFALLEGLLDEDTVLPEDLDEADFWEIIEQSSPELAEARSELTGNIREAFKILLQLVQSMDERSISKALYKVRQGRILMELEDSKNN